MKATITANNKTVDIELTAEQAKELGLVESKTGWERANKFGSYYSFCDFLSTIEMKEASSRPDGMRYDSGNYFADESLAKKMAKRISLMLRMQRWADEHNTEPIDWEDGEQEKYHIVYDYEYKKPLADDFYVLQRDCHDVCFTSREIAEQAIEVFGDEIKEMLGV